VTERGWQLSARGIVLACLALLVVWPLGRLVAEGAADGLGRMVEAIGAAGLTAIVNSLWISVVVTVLALGGGLAAAVLTERSAVWGRGALRAAIMAPLVIPDFVSAMSWERAYGPVGLTHRLFGLSLPGLVGPPGVVLVLAVGAVPLAYLVTVAGLRVRAEPDLERAARVSGAGAWTAFRTITLPLLSPVLAAAGGLVFVMTMNAFGTPAVLGRPAGFVTMTTRIYQDLAFSASDDAFRRVISLSVLMVVVAIAVVGGVDRVSVRSAARTVLSSGGRQPAPARGGRAGWLSVVGWLAVLLAVMVPLSALILAALTRAVGLAPVPGNLTLANFGRALDARALGDLGNSLVLAAGTAVLAVALGLVALAAGERWRPRLGTAVTLTFAVPGSVVAVAMLLAFGSLLRDTLAIIALAYLAKLWALGQRPVSGAVDRLPADLQRAARASGAGLFTGLRTISLPLLAPAIGAGALLVFVFALHELTISILLYGPRTATLAVDILNLQQVGDPVVTAALAVALTGIVAALTGLLLLVVRRWPWAGGIMG
jgi:iron(III) transport system permease protein